MENVQLKDYHALVQMRIRNQYKIQEDAIASIRTKGLLGERYIEVLPGGSSVILKDGDEIFDTEPPVDLIGLIKSAITK